MAIWIELMCDDRLDGDCYSEQDDNQALATGNLSAQVWMGVTALQREALRKGWRRQPARGNGGPWSCPACVARRGLGAVEVTNERTAVDTAGR